MNQIFEIFGEDVRLVGGCVRDLQLGKLPHDYDFATPLLPQEVIEVLEKNDIRHISPGLSHGTVTAIVDNVSYEITTLRVDKETDGRHATVEFSRDWFLDSCRRDFTCNALYKDRSGKIYDYHNGLEDITSKTVRFVGNAEERIQEDYLRILRYFRFRLKLGEAKTLFPQYEDIIRNNILGLSNVSSERINSELKLICNYTPYIVIINLIDVGFFHVMGLDFDWKKYDLNRNGFESDKKYLDLYSCFRNNPEEIKELLKLSNDEYQYLKDARQMDKKTWDYKNILIWKNLDGISEESIKLYATLNNLHLYNTLDVAPSFSKELMEQGYKGKELGVQIREKIRLWIEEKTK